MITRPGRSRALAILALFSASGVIAFAAVQAAKRGAAADTSSTVVATVNGEKITRGEIFDSVMADEAAREAASDPASAERVKQQRFSAGSAGALLLKKMSKNGWQPTTVSRAELMDFMFKDKPQSLVSAVELRIQEMAISQAAKKEGLNATPQEIAKKITQAFDTARKRTPNLAGKSDAEVMKWFGVRKGYFEPFVATQVHIEKMVRKEIEAKQGHPLGPNDFIAASHILIKVTPPITPAAPDASGKKPADDTEKLWADAKKKIDGILADIRSGKITFEQAAQQNSDDGSKFKGGSLGVFAKGKMVAEFEKAAFSQEKGKVGDPIRTQFGWHIIRVDKVGSDLTAPEREEVINELVQGRTPAKVQEIMSKAKIDNKLRPEPAMGGLNIPGGGAPRPGAGR